MRDFASQRPVLNVNTVSITTDGSQPDIQVINLDSVASIEQRLSDGLPINPEQARTTVDQRIAEISRSQLDADLRAAYLPLGTMVAIESSLDNLRNGVDNAINAIELAATAAIANLPGYILQKANPGLYDSFQNALLRANESFSLATKSCERI